MRDVIQELRVKAEQAADIIHLDDLSVGNESNWQDIFCREFAALIIRDCTHAAGPDDSYQDEWFRAKADAVSKIGKWFSRS